MQTATRESLRAIAGQLAVIAGVLHLGLGTYYTVGGPGVVAGRLRVVLWTVAGAVLVGGVAVAALGSRRPLLYEVGIVVVGALLATHVLWPALASGTFYLGAGPGVGHDAVGYVVAQFADVRPVAKVLVGVELVLLAVLVVLLAGGDRA